MVALLAAVSRPEDLAGAAAGIALALALAGLALGYAAGRGDGCRHCEHCRRRDQDAKAKAAADRHRGFHSWSGGSADDCRDPKCRGR